MVALRNRFLQPRIEEALTDTRIVVIQGARQVGKSTLASRVVAAHGGRLVTLDDEVTRAAAELDPAGFVRQFPGGLLAIDEVQRVPALILALGGGGCGSPSGPLPVDWVGQSAAAAGDAGQPGGACRRRGVVRL